MYEDSVALYIPDTEIWHKVNNKSDDNEFEDGGGKEKIKITFSHKSILIKQIYFVIYYSIYFYLHLSKQ